MPLYTYNGQLLIGAGGLAATDGFCCGACCIDGACAQKNKCECLSANGRWFAGKNCGDTDVNCDSSSSSSSSSSDSSYYSSSSYYTPYGACCTYTVGPPGSSESCWSSETCSTVDNPSDPDYGNVVCSPVVECTTVITPGETIATCSFGTEYDCYILGGVFYLDQPCTAVPCGSGSSSGSNNSSSSSSSRYSSSSSNPGGWVCKPFWVCLPGSSSSSGCAVDADCNECCPPGSTPTPKYDANGEVPGVGGCCPPGTTFDPETRTCGDTTPGPTVTGHCCNGECKCADESICQRPDCTTYNTDRDTCQREDLGNVFFPCGVIPTGLCCTGANCESDVTECACRLGGGTWAAGVACADIVSDTLDPADPNGTNTYHCQTCLDGGGTCCPDGCCPEANWVCCAGSADVFCAAAACDCPIPAGPQALRAAPAGVNNDYFISSTSAAEMLKSKPVNTLDNLPYICDD